MKRTCLKIIMLSGFVGILSCDNSLDLAPTDVLIEESVFADASTAESALADSYFKLFEATTGAAHVIADVSADYVGLKNGSSYLRYTSGNLIGTDYEVENVWTNIYEAVNVANVFIDKVPKYARYSVDIQKQHIAEAKFNRAYSYLMLLCYYGHGALTREKEGLGVPLQLKPYGGFKTEDLIPRSTNHQVYEHIIQDLIESIVDLPEAYADKLTTRVRATKSSARALLSRVFLYMGEYESCLTYSDQVLSNGSYKLDSNLLNLFPLNEAGVNSKFSDEVIFGFPVSSNKGNFQFGTHGIYYYNKYYWVTSEFIESMDVNDKRRIELIFDGNPFISDPVTSKEKTTFKFNNSDQRDDVIMIRLAEIMLNKAEALAQLEGVNTESIDLLNQIRNRSGLSSLSVSDFNSGQQLLDMINHERLIETAFEGRARFDLIRTGRSLRDPNLSDDQKVFPIPQREIDLSKGTLVQNPGY